MKIKNKLIILFLLAVLAIFPLQSVQARGLEGGPIFGSSFTLKSGETLNEDLIVFGGSVSIEKDARVNGSVVLFGGSITLDGEVTQDVLVLGGAASLGENTHIMGNLVTFGVAVSRAPGARVDGDVINDPTRPLVPSVPSVPAVPQVDITPVNPVWSILSVLGQSLMLALLATLIAMFLPNHMRRVADAVVAQPLLTFGMGLLTVIGFIVAIVGLALFSIFIITLIVTVPLIVILSIVFAAAGVLGWLALGMEVGVRISQMFRGEWPLPLAAGLGVFILNLVAQSVGGLLSAVLGTAGLGAVLVTRFGMRPAPLPLAVSATPEALPPAQIS